MWKKYSMIACSAFICLIFISGITRAITSLVLVQKFHLDNSFTRAVLFDRADLRKIDYDDSKKPDIEIEWDKLYPFSENAKNKNKTVSFADKVKFQVQRLDRNKENEEKKIIAWTNEKLVANKKIIEYFNGYKRAVNWGIVAVNEYNGVIEIEDGHLAAFNEEENMDEKIANVVQFAKFCQANGAEFIYVSAPSKIGRDEEKYAGLDYSNTNADNFLKGLRENNVNYIDIRDNIEAEHLVTRRLFFRTDHHWLPEAGLWATGIIARHLNEQNIIKSDLSLLKDDKWRKEIFKNYFLGSRGKKVTLNRTKPDDISIYHPLFPTNIHVDIPDENIKQQGDFDILYDKGCLGEVDYYHKNPYAAYSHADQPYMYIRNDNIMDNKKVLLIKNSFGNVVLPFLVTQFKHTYELDLRQFNGSAHNFIGHIKPDVVIVLYHQEHLNEDIYYNSHRSVWDFR